MIGAPNLEQDLRIDLQDLGLEVHSVEQLEWKLEHFGTIQEQLFGCTNNVYNLTGSLSSYLHQ